MVQPVKLILTSWSWPGYSVETVLVVVLRPLYTVIADVGA